MLLEEKGLSEYLEEDLEVITLHATDKEYRQHIKKEKKCKALLVKHIDDDQLEYVKDYSTAKDMYDSLAAVFEHFSVARQLSLRKKLITLKYRENGNIGNIKEHLLEFGKTIRELRSIGGKMEEIDVVCHLLLSLPSSFDSLVTFLETLHPKLLTLEFVKCRLLDENDKRAGKKERKDGFEFGSAMNANVYPFRCHNCGKEGHKRSECRYKGNYGYEKVEKPESIASANIAKKNELVGEDEIL